MISFQVGQKNEPDLIILYRISEAAEILGISIGTLRMYEREGLILPFRKGSKHRRFSELDLDRIRVIRSMINDEKLGIAGIKRLFALIPCWKIKSCSDVVKQDCLAFNQQDEPCWMVTPRSVSCSNADCRLCPVYRDHCDCKNLKQLLANNLPISENQRALSTIA
ncbi:MAG: MerR family transcriptional regulator [Bacteroidota bacterium]